MVQQQQVKDFAARCVEEYFPQETLIELLEEDKRTTKKWKYLKGNCLDGIQVYLMIFPYVTL